MFTIRTATRVLFAAAVLAVIGTAQAAEKPKSLAQGPNAPPSFTYQKIESIKSQGKPGTAKPLAGGVAPYLDGMRNSYKANHGKVGKLHGNR